MMMRMMMQKGKNIHGHFIFYSCFSEYKRIVDLCQFKLTQLAGHFLQRL